MPWKQPGAAVMASLLGPDQINFIWESSGLRSKSSFFTVHEPGRFSYLGFSPATTISVHGDLAAIKSRSSTVEYRCGIDFTDPLDLVQAAVEERFGCAAEAGPDLPPFVGGAVGFIAYDAIHYFEKIKDLKVHGSEPEICFALVDRFIAIDNKLQQLHLVSWPRVDESRDGAFWAESLFERLQQFNGLEQADTNLEHKLAEDLSSKFSEQEFVDLVERAKQYIVAGDIFQVVLSHKLSCVGEFDPLRCYASLKSHNPSPYHYLLRFSDIDGASAVLVGASPEVMMQSAPADSTGRTRVFMRPVAGTYPRAPEPEADLWQAQSLLNDEKERAEHLMLVDLERNDIGREAEIGTVQVKDLFSVETYRDVHHLVSEVSGVLPRGRHPLAALRSSFPIGTLAGTPKIRAMEIIAELEGAGRGIFGGAVVMLGADGMLDSCVAIRNAVIRPHEVTVRAGAGIVHDSAAAREHRECHWKAQAVLNSLGFSACGEPQR